MAREDCKLLHDFLNSQLLMSLSTTNGFNLWSTCVYYLNDSDLNLYFISGDHTNHVKNVLDNHKVAFTISNGDHSSDKLGVQARGFCEKVGRQKMLKMLEKWNSKFLDRQLTANDLSKNGASMYKIILTRLKFLNTKLPEKVIEFNF